MFDKVPACGPPCGCNVNEESLRCHAAGQSRASVTTHFAVAGSTLVAPGRAGLVQLSRQRAGLPRGMLPRGMLPPGRGVVRRALQRALQRAGVVLTARAAVALGQDRGGAGDRGALHGPAVHLSVLQAARESSDVPCRGWLPQGKFLKSLTRHSQVWHW